MRRNDFSPILWMPTQPRPGFAASFRRSNIVIISILAFLVLGFLIAGAVPNLKIHANSAAKSATSFATRERL